MTGKRHRDKHRHYLDDDVQLARFIEPLWGTSQCLK